MDISSQTMISAGPWTDWPLFEDSTDLCGGYSTFEEPPFLQNVPPDTEASSTFLPGWGDLPLTTCNDFGASDTLKAVQPELVPRQPRLPPMEEGMETLTGDCAKKTDEATAVREEIGQSSNSHGVFEETCPFDPFSNPAFVTREPISYGIITDEALFNLDDIGNM